MIIDMQPKKPQPPQSMVTHNLKYIVEILNEFIEHADLTGDEFKAVEGDDILQAFVRNSKELAEGLRDTVRYLELIISISERQDKGGKIIYD